MSDLKSSTGGRGPDRPIRVVHVCESFTAGTRSAILSYVSATPAVDHYLVASTGRAGSRLDVPDKVFLGFCPLPTEFIKALATIRGCVREWSPDVLHAHSSFGGMFSRLAVRRSSDLSIAYTPHGFGFERLDVNRLVRLVLKLAERAMLLNTDVVAGCSPREARLARGMGARHVVYVPNVAGRVYRAAETSSIRGEADRGNVEASRRVVVSGRISAARDPRFVADMAREAVHMSERFEVTWIGDGDDAAKEELRRAGVAVTGWQDEEHVAMLIREAGVVVHSGRWDGFPMAILEAYECGVPVVARSSKALEDAPESVVCGDAKCMAMRVARLLSDHEERVLNRRAWSRYLTGNTPEVQSGVLGEMYASLVRNEPGRHLRGARTGWAR